MRLRTRGAEVIALPWLSMTCATALVIAALLVFRVELFHRFQSYLAERGTDSSGVGLRVTRTGGDLRITWRRNAPAISSARSAALFINDGTERRVIDVSREELIAGQVVYEPASPEVVLRMEIEDASGRRTTESASVLGLRPDGGAAVTSSQPAGNPVPAEPPAEPALLTVPAPPQSALRSIAGTIRVDARATADATGAVHGAELISPGSSAYFARLALAAARASRLPPGAGSAVLHYEFTRAGVRVTRRPDAGAASR